ncbi:MAG TPA: galactose oxidase-like domain-containing protein [Gemmatimonadales bacterium]|nr:galactose oxidase-like domain-containing protein [Gemmatimonadales bacterium]
MAHGNSSDLDPLTALLERARVNMTRLKPLRFSLFVAVLAATSLRCSGDNIGPDPDAAAIAEAGGNGQTGTVGLPLPSPLVVLVTDDEGNPVANVGVSWSAQGGGSVSAATVSTNSNGRASVTRILGPAVGQQTTTASVSGLQGSPVTFVATAVEGPAAGGIVITTNPPTQVVDKEVFDPAAQPAVRLTDANGPLAGVQVTASIEGGSGTLQGNPIATTDANGDAIFADLGISGTGAYTLTFTAGTAKVSSSPVTVSALPAEAITGAWGDRVDWDIVPLHMSLLPTGKIVAWGKTDVSDTMGMPRIWDPAQGPPGSAQMVMTDSMLFCAGHTLMSDGTLMAAGGHLQDDRGTATTNFFSPDGVLQKGPSMAHARWYPTLTSLPDGRVLTMGGRNETGAQVTTPEIWENGQWVELPGAGTYVTPYYPRNFVDPKNGLIFYAGERIQSRWFDVDGAGTTGRGRWIAGPSHVNKFNRDYGSAVMYETGKILYVGGGGFPRWGGGDWPDAKVAVPTETAEIIDLTASNPTWQSTASMAFKRRHMNATVLPDGQVLATGGTSGGGDVLVNINAGLAVHEAEIWNPETGQWTVLARNNSNIMRLYHSVSLLLPDGTVLNGASGDAMTLDESDALIPVPPERNHEIFSPPYLFKGARPTITSAPANVGYGQTFSVVTPNAAQVTEVRWIRLGSVTHAFDAGARANSLNFQVSGGNVQVTAPLLPREAPPGHYMLFILNRNGVPSAGKIIRVQ